MCKKLFSLIISVFLLPSCSQLKKIGIQGVKKQQSAFRVAWSKNLDTQSNTGNLPIALNAPLIHKNLLYIGDNAGYMRAYNLENGREVWSQKEKTFYHTRPIISGRILLYGDADGRVYARDRLTGRLKYSIDLGASVESQALVYKGRAFFHTRNHQLFALDLETGKILWSYKRSVSQIITLQGASRPLVYEGKLFVGLADGTLCAFSLEEGMLLWERKISEGEKFLDVDMNPVIFNGRLYVGTISGNLHVFNGSTGQLLKVIPEKVHHSPKVIDGRLIYSTDKGELVALNQSEEEVARIQIAPNVPLGTIALWKDALLVSSIKGDIYLLDKTTYSLLEKISLGGHAYSAFFWPIQVEKDTMAVFSSRNRLYVYRAFGQELNK